MGNGKMLKLEIAEENIFYTCPKKQVGNGKSTAFVRETHSGCFLIGENCHPAGLGPGCWPLSFFYLVLAKPNSETQF